jgi:hypothetical protein
MLPMIITTGPLPAETAAFTSNWLTGQSFGAQTRRSGRCSSVIIVYLLVCCLSEGSEGRLIYCLSRGFQQRHLHGHRLDNNTRNRCEHTILFGPDFVNGSSCRPIGRLTLIHPMPIPGANQAHDIRDDETEQHLPPFNISSPNR